MSRPAHVGGGPAFLGAAWLTPGASSATVRKVRIDVRRITGLPSRMSRKSGYRFSDKDMRQMKRQSLYVACGMLRVQNHDAAVSSAKLGNQINKIIRAGGDVAGPVLLHRDDRPLR